MGFQLVTPYKPRGDQPRAIEELVNGLGAGEKHQVLLGVTGSGGILNRAQDGRAGQPVGVPALRATSAPSRLKSCKILATASVGAHMNSSAVTLAEKIQSLSAEQIAEVEDFVEFVRLREHERGMIRTAAAASAPAFEAVWDNLEDAAYDAL
jgi:hypothetical protein